MATTAKSKTTKTKPAKKPATKPAGANVKPKQTKTVKTASKSTVAKTTTSSKAAKPTKIKNRTCEVFFGIIMIILAIAIIAGVATYFFLGARKNDETVMIETGKGNQVGATLTALPDSKASILVPNDFRKLNDAEIEELKKSESSEDVNIKVAYANSDKTVIVYFTESDEASDDEIKQGITDLARVLKNAGIKDIKTNIKETDGHSIGTIEFSGMNEATYPYQYIAFFSNNGKASSVAFGCTKNFTEEWQKVGTAIINSLTFAK